MEVSELLPALPTYFKELFSQVEVALKEQLKRTADLELNLVVVRNRCFLAIGLSLKDFTTTIPTPFFFDSMVAEQIREMIHLPGLRGNPERTYPITAVSSSFPGTFENYFASVIGQWQVNDNKEKLGMLNRDLMRLGLTSNVVAQPVNDTQVELRINRLLRTNHDNVEDMVSIADVGLGVSQTLPVLVALHLADPGQLIFLEQPEIHLHPRAQFILAEVLADAALRGINLVVETHSSLLLLGIQTLVAEGKLPAEKIKLHWFDRPENGSTRITSADLDETGAFGNWPEDFAAVTLDAEGRFLDAQSKLAEI